MMRKVNYFYAKNVFTGKRMKYAKIIVFNEPMNIRGIKFNMDNVYNTPAECVNDESMYQQPLNNPRYNTDRAFNIYRNKMGLLKPQQIKHERHVLHLSQPETSAILGISYSTLSKIENNRLIQSVSQDTELRNLFNIQSLVELIKARLPIIKIKHDKRIKINHLTNIINKFNKANKKQKSIDLIRKLPLRDMIMSYCHKKHLTRDQLAKNNHIPNIVVDKICKN